METDPLPSSSQGLWMVEFAVMPPGGASVCRRLDARSGLSVARFGIPAESPTSSASLDMLGFLSLGLLIPKTVCYGGSLEKHVITMHNYHLFFVGQTLKIYSLSDFPVYMIQGS